MSVVGSTPDQREATDEQLGLTSAEARRRLGRDGPNVLPAARRPHPVLMLAAQLVHFFALMLWAAAGLALLAGMPALAVAIAVVVLLNGVFAFVQEYRADLAAQRLRELLPSRVTVRRDGRAVVVDAADLVTGDVVLLDAGDRVCADLSLLRAHRLAVDESLLTGESVPVRPEPGATLHAGTHVVEGQAVGLVSATGSGTRLAGIAVVTQRAHRPRSPLSAQLHRVVTVVGAIAVGVGVLFFGVAVALGFDATSGFLFAIGVTVALVPEGLLPTVTLSLARAAQRMAGRNALVRRLESVETLGATTFICSDKTGTLTRNEMTVVRVWTPRGEARVRGEGYDPDGEVLASEAVREAVRAVADSAARCSPDAHAVRKQDAWRPVGDPMEVALHVLAARAGVPEPPRARERHPFDPRRRRSSVVDVDGVHVTGAMDSVLPRCAAPPEAAEDAEAAALRMSRTGLRVLAVARRRAPVPAAADDPEHDLELLGLVGLEDPPRPDVAAAIASCRRAGIRVAMITGDHPATAAAIAREVGLLGQDELVVAGGDLPPDEAALGRLLDRDGVVVARVTPEDKLRIARALQARGHVVAMTGDGVNDGPALRAADIGVAMGASGTDVAREAADLVLLDDHFATIVGAVELGRATFANIRRFLTYHLTDNVAELAPFVVWALSGGSVPLALSVLQILALDIGTDLLPALALGAEPPHSRTMAGPARRGRLIDGGVVRRAFAVLGPTEALVAVGAFVLVLLGGGWRLGQDAPAGLLATASGTAFAAVVFGQLANAFACRSETRWVGRVGLRGNTLLWFAVVFELAVLLAVLSAPYVPALLGGTTPSPWGWALALCAVPAVLLADGADKAVRALSTRRRTAGASSGRAPRRRPAARPVPAPEERDA
ncbi:cation-translocating P-type ATPase [Streptoalloteichus hindustanus]|uniref:Plasma-membrane calcium-translocating P-type ATPase n=1 Tax=Streptoalloteichus hindustanus TaxID=2017 RepID=A0A1M5DTZ0_STRHI|nr:cation-transporting P-type ATPase [Streptoalloteichus hindustanus]SHF70386.1 plasma-membrane calcium-translocating P-type ATPase [Streptoalloteichus hindustanus]